MIGGGERSKPGVLVLVLVLEALRGGQRWLAMVYGCVGMNQNPERTGERPRRSGQVAGALVSFVCPLSSFHVLAGGLLAELPV